MCVRNHAFVSPLDEVLVILGPHTVLNCHKDGLFRNSLLIGLFKKTKFIYASNVKKKQCLADFFVFVGPLGLFCKSGNQSKFKNNISFAVCDFQSFSLISSLRAFRKRWWGGENHVPRPLNVALCSDISPHTLVLM